MMLALALTRIDIANYVSTLFVVYILLIFVYILLTLLFSFGVRTPYSRWSDAVLSFLRDVCEPYLRIFRSCIPPIGMFDLTPMIAIIVLYVVRTIVVNAIARLTGSGLPMAFSATPSPRIGPPRSPARDSWSASS